MFCWNRLQLAFSYVRKKIFKHSLSNSKFTLEEIFFKHFSKTIMQFSNSKNEKLNMLNTRTAVCVQKSECIQIEIRLISSQAFQQTLEKL